jgi:thiamine biosynthesis protein ThiS
MPVPRGAATAEIWMHIKLNGRDHEVSASTSVLGLLESLGLDARKIAVERNLEIVPRSAHGTTVLTEGDRLEIVNFVGGG